MEASPAPQQSLVPSCPLGAPASVWQCRIGEKSWPLDLGSFLPFPVSVQPGKAGLSGLGEGVCLILRGSAIPMAGAGAGWRALGTPLLMCLVVMSHSIPEHLC